MAIPDNVRYLVADTETTGAGPRDKVCELGWIELDEHMNVIGEVESLIDPQYMISPSASGIHGLVNADVENSPTIEEYFSVEDPSCYGRKITDPIVLIGHRISFDTRFLAPYMNVIQELCTLRWARKLYPDADDHKLSTLMFALGLPKPENAHRVMSDIYSAFYLAKHICERTGATLRQLAEASVEPMIVGRMPFGKHKGQDLLTEVPKSYIRWALGNMADLDGDLKFTFETALNKKKNKDAEPTLDSVV